MRSYMRRVFENKPRMRSKEDILLQNGHDACAVMVHRKIYEP